MIELVAISDLHLGVKDSCLTPSGTSCPCLDDLIDAWKKEIPKDVKKPTLVIIGDLLDLSLASYAESMPAAKIFFTKIVGAELFKDILYIPGNHDHHIWHHIVEEKFVYEKILPSCNLQSDYPRTKSLIVTDQGDECDSGVFFSNTFLNGFLPANSSITNIKVTYPNLLLKPENDPIPIIFTHGHFFEKSWTFITDITKEIFKQLTIDDFETYNAPLTEFIWYNLGQSKKLSDLVDDIYSSAQSGNTNYLDNLMHMVMQGIEAMNVKAKHKIEQHLIDNFMEFSAKEVVNYLFKGATKYSRKASMRNMEIGDTIPKVEEYFKNYLANDLNQANCSKYKVVFGHTHQPGKGLVTINDNPIEIYNTGGWILDKNDLLFFFFLVWRAGGAPNQKEKRDRLGWRFTQGCGLGGLALGYHLAAPDGGMALR